MIMKVACFFSQHSPILGQPASSQTVDETVARARSFCVSGEFLRTGRLDADPGGFSGDRLGRADCAFSGWRTRSFGPFLRGVVVEEDRARGSFQFSRRGAPIADRRFARWIACQSSRMTIDPTSAAMKCPTEWRTGEMEEVGELRTDPGATMPIRMFVKMPWRIPKIMPAIQPARPPIMISRKKRCPAFPSRSTVGSMTIPPNFWRLAKAKCAFPRRLYFRLLCDREGTSSCRLRPAPEPAI